MSPVKIFLREVWLPGAADGANRARRSWPAPNVPLLIVDVRRPGPS
jgi:hypothetical protein